MNKYIYASVIFKTKNFLKRELDLLLVTGLAIVCLLANNVNFLIAAEQLHEYILTASVLINLTLVHLKI